MLKLFVTIFCWLSITPILHSQNNTSEKIKITLIDNTDDTSTVKMYLKIADSLFEQLLLTPADLRPQEIDSINKVKMNDLYQYATTAQKLSEKLNWNKGLGLSLYRLVEHSFLMEDYMKSLTPGLQGFAVTQNEKDTLGMVSFLQLVSLAYRNSDDFQGYLDNSRKAWLLAEAMGNRGLMQQMLYHVGESFLFLKNADSSSWYFNHNFNLLNSLQDAELKESMAPWSTVFDSRDLRMAYAYYGLGGAQHLLKNHEIALSYLYKCLEHADKIHSPTLYSDTYKRLADVYLDAGNIDSSILYARKCQGYAGNVQNALGTYDLLASIYHARNNDTAVKYYQLAAVLRDSVYSAQRRMQINNISQAEKERQENLADQAHEVRTERNRNLQLASIAVCLITFIILFLLLSQSIIVKSGFVKFLGALALLLVFEFINLWLHPVIGDFTHHSPVLMFLIMVCVASLLVPAHHRIEQWITTKLVAKNRKIRLVSAKKTIAALENSGETK